MKSSFTQTKINAILLTLFGSFSAYSMASGVCSNPSGCRIGSGSNLHGTVLISGQNYKNSVPNVNDVLSGIHYSVVFDTNASGETEPIQLIFEKNANIVLDSSFLNDPAYGDEIDHFHLTGVNIQSDSSSAIIPKGVQFTLKGYPNNLIILG